MLRMVAVGIVRGTATISRRLENRRPRQTDSVADFCVDRDLRRYYAAAATYEQLARLSDAELHRRGLSRATLGRDVCEALDRSRSGART